MNDMSLLSRIPKFDDTNTSKVLWPMVIVQFIMSSALTVMSPFLPLLVLRLAMGAFSGFSASAIALVATQISERQFGYALGWLSTGQLVGGLIGPMIGGSFADWIGNYRFVFFWTSAVSLLAVIIILVVVKERKRDGQIGWARDGTSMWKQISGLRNIQGLGTMFVVLLLAQFATRAVQPVVTLYVRELVGTTAYLSTLAGLAFSITGVGDLIASPFLGKRSDRIGYKRVLTISLLGSALLNIPQASIHNIWVFLSSRFVMGMLMGGILPTANAWIGRLASADNRGKVYGLTASATFLGSFLGPMLGGVISARFSISDVFYLTAALLTVNWIWVQFKTPDVSY